MTKYLAAQNVAGTGNVSVYLPWRSFFPGFEEKFLICNKQVKITLQLATLTGILISLNSTAGTFALAAKDATGVNPVLYMKQIHNYIPEQ